MGHLASVCTRSNALPFSCEGESCEEWKSREEFAEAVLSAKLIHVNIVKVVTVLLASTLQESCHAVPWFMHGLEISRYRQRSWIYFEMPEWIFQSPSILFDFMKMVATPELLFTLTHPTDSHRSSPPFFSILSNPASCLKPHLTEFMFLLEGSIAAHAVASSHCYRDRFSSKLRNAKMTRENSWCTVSSKNVQCVHQSRRRSTTGTRSGQTWQNIGLALLTAGIQGEPLSSRIQWI